MDKTLSAKSYWKKEEAEKYDKGSSIRKIQIEMTQRLLYHMNNISAEQKNDICEAHILDIGCGTGFSLEVLKGAIGIDISLPMLKIAKRKGFKKLIRADFKHLPFKNNSFDITISISTIQWITGKTPEEVISQYKQFCRELKRILKNKGKAGLQFYPSTKKEFEILTKELKKYFKGYIVEEGKGKKRKKYIILENK